jgi:hypothetical protein
MSLPGMYYPISNNPYAAGMPGVPMGLGGPGSMSAFNMPPAALPAYSAPPSPMPAMVGMPGLAGNSAGSLQQIVSMLGMLLQSLFSGGGNSGTPGLPGQTTTPQLPEGGPQLPGSNVNYNQPGDTAGQQPPLPGNEVPQPGNTTVPEPNQTNAGGPAENQPELPSGTQPEPEPAPEPTEGGDIPEDSQSDSDIPEEGPSEGGKSAGNEPADKESGGSKPSDNKPEGHKSENDKSKDSKPEHKKHEDHKPKGEKSGEKSEDKKPKGHKPESEHGPVKEVNDKGKGKGWNKNVSVMASSSADKETRNIYSGGKLVGGYLHELEKGMDDGKGIEQANAKAQGEEKPKEDGAISYNVGPDSLVKGKGGKALIVTGDGYTDDKDADQLADKLKKNYGMDVKVIKDASPNQMKSEIEKMGKEGGKQAVVAVLAHGAKDGSGKKEGKMAMGKGDGDQWLSEEMLKKEVNGKLAPKFGHVNVLLNSCYSGNFAD